MARDPIEALGSRLTAQFGLRVVQTWLEEFGYTVPDIVSGFYRACAERPERIAREIDAHGKRLADRATMSRAPVGRAGVIPR